MNLFWSVTLFALACAADQVVRYDGHKVIRVIPEVRGQVDALFDLMNNSITVDFWLEPRSVGQAVDIRVPPTAEGKDLLQFLAAHNMSHQVHIEDVQDHLDEALLPVGADWDDAYHKFDDVTKWMQGLATANPDIATVFKMGTTFQKRDVYGIKITGKSKSKSNGADKPQLYYDGGIHAREWIAPAVVEYIIGQLINGYKTDPSIKEIVDAVEFHLIPVFNADGYSYCWTNDRMWRKTRQPNSGSSCVGTDPCRNADAGWGGAGSSSNPCSDIYHGSAPFSAVIVKAASVYLATLKNLKGYINFHSNAQSWLTPYGYTGTKPKDYSTQEAFAKQATEAIKAVNGERYPYGPAYTTIYPASGIISDWVYDKLGAVLSQAVELRGNSFSPPASLIKPNGAEIFAAVKVMAKAVAQL